MATKIGTLIGVAGVIIFASLRATGVRGVNIDFIPLRPSSGVSGRVGAFTYDRDTRQESQ